MKNSMLILTVVAFVAVAASSGVPDTAVANALHEQNKQLTRIADSLERISGQQPGWKVPTK